MTPAAILLFVLWEICLFAAALAISWRWGWLAVLAVELTLESSLAALFSFTHLNSPAAYWAAAAVCAVAALLVRPALPARLQSFEGIPRWHFALLAALAVPLVCLSFHPVEEIDSINYLHYLIDWMGNRATPYTFATNYVAFWELSFLPAWTVTRVDVFFPLLALKSIALLAGAAWLVGRELGLRGPLLLWTVAMSLSLRHLWFESSGVGTLKNDALHGAGFLLLMLAVLKVGQASACHGGRPARLDFAYLAFGATFAAVKYTGIFLAGLTLVALAITGRMKLRDWRWHLAGLLLFLLTSGHYYLHNLIQSGSPFYPFQINLGPIHLPGTADLSATSILYSLRDPRLWRTLFWPPGIVSPAGLLFPLTLAAVLPLAAWRCIRGDWAAACLLCGWFLYFRSVFSASAQIGGGDLTFLLYGLNSIRYVDGVLAATDLWLVSLVRPAIAWPLIAIQLASRLWILYPKIPADLFPPIDVAAAAILTGAAVFALGRRAMWPAVATLVLAGPFLVDRNRAHWTTYWNGLKPSLDAVQSQGLAVLAMPDGGYFASHVVAAGNPVDPAVRALLPEDLDAGARPPYLAVMPSVGVPAADHWRELYGPRLAAWGYRPQIETPQGGLFHR